MMNQSRTKHVSPDTFNEALQHLFSVEDYGNLSLIQAFVSNAVLPQLKLSYHNYDHAIDVSYAFLQIWTQNHFPERVEIGVHAYHFTQEYKQMLNGVAACLLHDVVYIPGAPEGVNEQMSALTARRFFEEQGLAASFNLDLICGLIEATARYNDPIVSEDADNFYSDDFEGAAYLKNCVLDADLSSLAHPVFTDYVALREDILKEMFSPGTTVGIDAWKTFTNWIGSNLFNRETVFRTEWAINKWEGQAVSNLKMLKAVKLHEATLFQPNPEIRLRGIAKLTSEAKSFPVPKDEPEWVAKILNHPSLDPSLD